MQEKHIQSVPVESLEVEIEDDLDKKNDKSGAVYPWDLSKTTRNHQFGKRNYTFRPEGHYDIYRSPQNKAKSRVESIEQKLDNVLSDEDIEELKNELEAIKSLISQIDDDDGNDEADDVLDTLTYFDDSSGTMKTEKLKRFSTSTKNE